MITGNGYRMRDIDRLLRGTAAPAGAAYPPVDVAELDDHYRVDAELPGRSLEQIDVRVEDGLLVLRSVSTEAGKTQGRRSFRRSFALPRDVDPTGISARYRDGILSVHLPRTPESRPRSIEIE